MIAAFVLLAQDAHLCLCGQSGSLVRLGRGRKAIMRRQLEGTYVTSLSVWQV